eukprot:gene19813-773_t
MNDVSSRSHAVLQVSLKQKNPLTGRATLSNVNLVDLAGSERNKLSGSEGVRLEEATRINLSLSTLRRVIDALIENQRRKKAQPKVVPPLRESLLTWLLGGGECLGGNSKTMMIATYAHKAKEIVCNVRRNDERGAVIVSALRAEMERLRGELSGKEDAAGAEAAAFDELNRDGDRLRAQHAEVRLELAQKAGEERALRQKQRETRDFREKERAARLEMQQTKQRQLALAFRNSLQIHRDRRQMAALADEQAAARAACTEAERGLEQRRVEVARARDECRHLSASCDAARQRVDDANRNYDDSAALLHDKIAALSQRREAADAALRDVDAEIAEREEELRALRADDARTAGDTDALIAELDAASPPPPTHPSKYRAACAANTATDAEVAAAQRAADAAAAAAAEVDEQHRELVAENRALRARADNAREHLTRAGRHQLGVEGDIGHMADEVRRIARDHRDLTSFVSRRLAPHGR